MFRFIAKLFATSKFFGPKRRPPISRRAKLGVESLEGRRLPSASPIFASIGHIEALKANFPQPPPLAPMPDLSGVHFHLISSSGKPAHDLVIQSETIVSGGTAIFDGTWTGYGANGGSPHQILNGKLIVNRFGSVSITFAWANGSGGQNQFQGTITRLANNGVFGHLRFGNHYHLEGDVTTPVAGDGPGHVSGDGGIPFPVMSKL